MIDSDHNSKQLENNALPGISVVQSVVEDDPLEKFMLDIESKATKQETFDDQGAPLQNQFG